MIQLIQQALAVGWTAKQILNYLSGKVKNLSGGIENSRKSGYNDDDILKFIQGKIKSPKSSKVNEPDTAYGRYLKQSGLLTKEERQERKEKGMKSALQAGGTALAAYSAYQNAGRLGQSMASMGQAAAQPTAGPSPIGPAPMSTAPGSTPMLGPQQPTPTGAALTPQQPGQPPSMPVPSTAAPAAPQVANEAQRSYEAIAGSNFGPIVEKLKEAISPEDAKSLAKRYVGSNFVKDLEKTLQKPFEAIFQEYKSIADTQGQEQIQQGQELQQPIQEQEQGLGQQLDQGQELGQQLGGELAKEQPEELQQTIEQLAQEPAIEEVEEIESEPEEEKPVSKGSLVFSKGGDLGTIEDLPGKTAKIESNGKKKVLKTEDLIESPLPEEELADLYENLFTGIEKKTGEEVSRNVNLAGWDPAKKSLLYRPHGGASYIYNDIPETLIEKLLSVMTRKTSGENMIGAWEQGTESPIGAAMSEIVKELVATRGRGKEYSYKFDTIYDPLEPARKASSDRFKEKKKAESKRKRDEKKRR